MSIYEQNLQVKNYINGVSSKVFSNAPLPHLPHIKSCEKIHINSILSEIHNRFFFNFYISICSILDIVFFKANIPSKFLVLEFITFFLVIFPYVIMVFDACFSWTTLGKFSYFFASLCGAVLFITVLIAKKEWMDYKKDGKI